jgi:hypothetical protein
MRRLAVAVLVGLAASAAPALARPLADPPPCTVTFTDGAGNELWSDAANWSSGAVPAAADDACIPSGFPVVFVDAPAQARSLEAANAALFVRAALSVGAGGADASALDVGAGDVSLAGPLTAATVRLHGGSLGGAGAQTIGILRWSSGTLDGAATVNGDAILSGTLAGAGLRIAPGAAAHVPADTTLAVPLRNDGVLSVDGGVLTLTGGSDAGSGSYQVAAGATLDWHSGTYALSSPSVAGPGAAQVSAAARLDLTGASRVDAPLAIAGTLALSAGASLDVTGALANSGTVRLGGAALSAGGYTQAAGATLAEPLGGGVLAVRGAAALDGTLAFDRGDAVPDDGASFPVIRYGSLSGGWATVAVAPLAGFSFRVAYAQDAAALTVHRDPLPIPPPPPPPPPPTPVPGVRSVAVADRGTVLVRQPAGPQPGVAATFEPLKGTTSLPVGSVIDARKGQVTLTTASSFAPGAPGRSTTVSVAAAIFRIRQVHATDGRTAVTDVLVSTPPGLGRACLPPHKGVTRTLKRSRHPARVSHRTIRRVRVTAKGLVRAFGKVAVVSTRNGAFEMRDRCDGTSARLIAGRASLFDRRHGRASRLRARHLALVRARLFAARRLHLKRVPRPKP